MFIVFRSCPQQKRRGFGAGPDQFIARSIAKCHIGELIN
jgi:hypothetical protein